MSNFYTDNADLVFTLKNLDFEEVVTLRENGFKEADKWDYAPTDYADAMDNYDRVLAVVGEIAGERIAPRSRQVDEEGPHFENNTVTIRDNLSYAYDEWYISTTKTEGSERVLKLSNYTRNLLLIHKEHQDKSKEVVGKAWKHPDIVFTSSVGNYFDRTYVNKYLKKLCEENGLPPVSIHKLRHSNASLLINSGAALKAVSDRLGHCNIAITADIYGHIFDSYEARMAQSLENDLL